jgi:hypothetical protein
MAFSKRVVALGRQVDRSTEGRERSSTAAWPQLKVHAFLRLKMSEDPKQVLR